MKFDIPVSTLCIICSYGRQREEYELNPSINITSRTNICRTTVFLSLEVTDRGRARRAWHGLTSAGQISPTPTDF